MTLTATYDNLNVGTATANASWGGDANHTGNTDSKTFAITPAVAVVTLDNLTQTYTGTPRSVTVTTVPAGLTVEVTYDGSLTRQPRSAVMPWSPR